MMKLTILGSGTSTGVPVLLCKCPVCRSRNPRNQRLRASAWLQIQGKSLLIDTSTDFRQQALRAKIPRIDAVLYTHPHSDHVQGIDELRCYNFVQKSRIPVYGNLWTQNELCSRFPYIFEPKIPEGGGIPELTFHLIQAAAPFFRIPGLNEKIIPLTLAHGSQECVGYRISSLAYVTDCSSIPDSTLERMSGLSILVLDCLRITAHKTHFNLDQALDLVAKLKPKKTFLTHLGHDMDYTKWMKRLPKGVAFAYDGLSIKAH
jgi:phosphoribosyl 1,2-cyclic phosphate phosphodiesterase